MTAGRHLSPPRRRLRAKTSFTTTLTLPRNSIAVAAPGAGDAATEAVKTLLLKASAQTAVSTPQNGIGDVPHFGRFEVGERNDDYLIVKKAFDDAMLARLLKFLNRKRPKAAKMKNEGGDSDDERKARYEDRDCGTSWFSAENECRFLHDHMALIVKEVGNKQWPLLKVKFDGSLDCEYEQTQYTVYRKNQHFQAWHQDAYAEGHDHEDARQITLVVMLTSRKDYTGGDLQGKVKNSSGRGVIRKLRMDKGDVAVFPAKRLPHRVSVVKSGLRKTLVFWAFDRLSCHAGRAAAAEKKKEGIGIL